MNYSKSVLITLMVYTYLCAICRTAIISPCTRDPRTRYLCSSSYSRGSVRRSHPRRFQRCRRRSFVRWYRGERVRAPSPVVRQMWSTASYPRIRRPRRLHRRLDRRNLAPLQWTFQWFCLLARHQALL